MCGIFAVLGLTGYDDRAARKRVVELTKRLRHRGPDWETTSAIGDGNYLSHLRLAIVAPGEVGNQPLFINKGEPDEIAWIHNGEIYNYEALEQDLCDPDSCDPTLEFLGSDSVVVGHLYKKHGVDMVHLLDGMFAFVVCDKAKGTFFAARDHMGKIPMYIAYGKDGSVWFSSEMKSFVNEPMIERYEIFPPGMMYTGGKGGKGFERWYNPIWWDENKYLPTTPADLTHLREVVVEAVLDRMMADVPFGVLLSGGLDSSLVSSIAVKHLNKAKNAYTEDGKLHSFTIGLEGAPDLAAARAVADQIGTIHHEFHFTVQEALDAIPDVVYHLESFEQVRASVPMFLLSRKIKAMGIKMVLSGEGADETLGGYLYFHKAPSAEEFHKECVRKTTRLHQWDVMRANKSTMAWGVEARTPFLGQKFLETVMNIRPEDKMIDVSDKPDGVHPRMEKYILRKAFDTPDDPYLPDEVLWRQKEQFSDGVGYDWVDGLKEHADREVSDEDFANRAVRFPKNPPETKEYYYLRSLFEEYYPEPCALDTVPFGKSIACSTPEAVAWDPEWEKSTGDISGRAVAVHDSSSGFKLGESSSSREPKKAPASACLSAGCTFKATIRAPARRTLRLPQQFKTSTGARSAPRAPVRGTSMRGLAVPAAAFAAL